MIADNSLKKIIKFTDHDLNNIQKQIDEGWSVVSLTVLDNCYAGIIEKNLEAEDKDLIYIPPIKKIRSLT